MNPPELEQHLGAVVAFTHRGTVSMSTVRKDGGGFFMLVPPPGERLAHPTDEPRPYRFSEEEVLGFAMVSSGYISSGIVVPDDWWMP